MKFSQISFLSARPTKSTTIPAPRLNRSMPSSISKSVLKVRLSLDASASHCKGELLSCVLTSSKVESTVLTFGAVQD